MTANSVVPQPEDVGTFLEQLRRQRARLAALTGPGGTETDELARAVDEVGEQLLVADEELRVQSEHLQQSTRRLDVLVAAYEELFANAPTAYIQTDADGLILQMNRAAARLLDVGIRSQRSRTLPGAVRPNDRAAVRHVLSRLRAGPGRSAAVTHEPVEAAVVRPDGSEVPVVLTARRTTDPETGRPWFHWEVQEQGAPAAAAPGRAVARPGTPVATALAEVAAELARRDDPVQALEYVAAKAATLVPGSDAVGVTIARSGGRVEAAAATHELAEACDRVQFQLHEGPCLSAMDVSAPKHALDLAREKRWPRFARLAARVGARSLIAVPLTAQRGTVGALTFYARTPNAFDREDVLLAQAYATHAAIALAHAELEANLRLGMETREEIGRAVGILMERHRITSAAAFDMLVLASQQSHRKLRDIAAWMNETGEDPSTLISEPEQPPG